MTIQKLGEEVPARGNLFSKGLGRLVLAILGWRVEGDIPNCPKVIVAVAPHTSNMDFILAIAVVLHLGLKASFLAKHTLFKFPLRSLMIGLGGIPVDRGSAQGMIMQMTATFETEERLMLGITPEGTRSKVDRWKRGFALIAQRASVPILPALLDYESKTVRFCPLIADVSDPDVSLATMKQLAGTVTPKYQDKFSG